MKKILSLVLASAMAVGMTVSSFAAVTDAKVTITASKSTVQLEKGKGATVELEVTKVDGVDTALDAAHIEWSGTGVEADVDDGLKAILTIPADAEDGKIEVTATYDNKETDPDDSIKGTGKVEIIVKAYVAPTSKKIDKVADDFSEFVKDAEKAIDKKDAFNAGDTLFFPINASNFTWVGEADGATKPKLVTEAMLKSAKISLQTSISKGAKAIDKIEIDTEEGQVGVKVTFADPFVNTKDLDFEFKVYLKNNKSRVKDSEVAVVGTLKVKEEEVHSDDEYLYIGDGTVVIPKEYVRNIKLQLSDDVTLTTKLFNGKKYFGVAENKFSAADEKLLDKHSEISAIYTIKHINLNNGSSVVEFDIDDKYYVYGADGKFLGTTADKLAFSEKYYLTTKKIDLDFGSDVEDEDDVTEAPVEEEKPANNNPDTGVNGMVNVAVVAGVVALAAAGAVVLKK